MDNEGLLAKGLSNEDKPLVLGLLRLEPVEGFGVMIDFELIFYRSDIFAKHSF